MNEVMHHQKHEGELASRVRDVQSRIRARVECAQSQKQESNKDDPFHELQTKMSHGKNGRNDAERFLIIFGKVGGPIREE